MASFSAEWALVCGYSQCWHYSLSPWEPFGRLQVFAIWFDVSFSTPLAPFINNTTDRRSRITPVCPLLLRSQVYTPVSCSKEPGKEIAHYYEHRKQTCRQGYCWAARQTSICSKHSCILLMQCYFYWKVVYALKKKMCLLTDTYRRLYIQAILIICPLILGEV